MKFKIFSIVCLVMLAGMFAIMGLCLISMLSGCTSRGGFPRFLRPGAKSDKYMEEHHRTNAMVMPPALPSVPQRTNVDAPRLSRSVMLEAQSPLTLDEWSNGLAGSNGGTCDLRPDGSMVIDSRVLAHYNGIYMLADKTPSLLLPLGTTWLLTSNQAQAFMALDQKLRREYNLALYSGN